MGRNNYNGSVAELAQYETPFADISISKETNDVNVSGEDFFSDYFKEVESPFSRTYEATSLSNIITPAGEEYVTLLSELNNSEFNETIYELVNEVEDTWRNKVSDEIAMGNNYIPFATQQARDYFVPLIRDSENMIEQVSQQFSGNNFSDYSDSEIESFFSNLEFNHSQYSPAQEQFFGKIFDKVKSVVKKGVDLAKKGVATVGKLLPINIILKKIKGLIKPLLNKVLKFAIGKLPKNLQPHAHTLAKKFLNLETGEENTVGEIQSEDGLDGIQTELDNYIAQLVFSGNETESENIVMNYETSNDSIERINSYETANADTGSLHVARQQFINELKNLGEGGNPAPAIERFLPAAILALQPVIKIAISLIGREKVINFLAGLLAKLVAKYVPANVARPLAASIIDVGMSAIGFEVHETGKTDLAYEAIANTIEETMQNMTNLNEASLNDTEGLTMNLLEAFEQAAANNFPSQYIKEELRPTKHKAIWIAMPRHSTVKFYKKFTHIYDVTIDPQTANTVTIFRGLPLANFLKDKYGLETTKPLKARAHLYELNKNGRLNLVSKFEQLPGLNAKQPKAWVQLLPLTKQAASLLLKEPNLGKDFDSKTLVTRFRAGAGQRFYYLEIEGARLRIPPVNRSKHNHAENSQAVSNTESRSTDIQCTINFIKSEISLNYYFSEEDAKAVVEKLNKNDFLGAAINIRQSVKNVLHDMLVKNISSKVKIVHEAIPELYLENITEEQFAPLDALGKIAGKEIISKLVEKVIAKISTTAYEAMGNFFKARAAEFKQAQAEPQDGVTVKLKWINIQGMSGIRAVINAIRGNLSIGSLKDIALPNIPAPDIKIEADKKFD